MKKYQEMTREELLAEQQSLQAEFDKIKAKGLSLDMSRGKPGTEQLELAMPMLDVVNSKTVLKSENGTDLRNYGILDGIPEAKRLIASMIDVDPEMILVYGNSSLNSMYDQVARAYYEGICGHTPWCKLEKVKFLCPVPGYDRHFAITEHFGIEMINIDMNEDGPLMEQVEEAVKDPSVKGIWCVPKYSNPEGVVYSDETVRRFAALKPAAEDFRIFWDNAYAVHHLYEDEQAEILNIFDEAKKYGNEDMIFEFCSTSKVSFPGSGVAGVAASKKNLEDIKSQLTYQTIGFDKINQYRHVAFFKDRAGIDAHMMKQAAIIRPKFEMLNDLLSEEIAPRGIGNWKKPLGGYFISFEALQGCAKEIIAKCKEAGVTMTGAGSPFPYKKDPKDSVIRIAPTYPSLEELTEAAKVFVTVVRLVSCEKMLAQ
ncbi:MAG: aminotransferase class I/II-fold pyridoxal phosphate-dependent enzyme [Agathobacter sp.]|uniref:aminotransferase class I/II-fold pyridoxal phosphate-dependent enzyme n=1 Tax=Agathobacter sp. TaxID=2021311 RepID=UPI0025910CD7|nr:aminotransferase class I/II-fold pyridoxal phosphate-dependent enzyme [Agathobacter sp.]MCR5676779.1 aminotransferase class I/II-fold pyridoxal phosphate-dependent enzyme [Agathobacter sp.]